MCVVGEDFLLRRRAAQVLCALESSLMPCKHGLSDIPQPSGYFPGLCVRFACEVVVNHAISVQKILPHGVE